MCVRERARERDSKRRIFPQGNKFFLFLFFFPFFSFRSMLFLFYRYLNVSNRAGNLHENEWTVNLYDEIDLSIVSSMTSSVPFFRNVLFPLFVSSICRNLLYTCTRHTRRKSEGSVSIILDQAGGFWLRK